jgi:AraC family cel operon transcriptional repressor
MGAIRIPDVYIDPELESNADLVESIKYATPLHNHDFYEFFLITSGKCIHYVNGQTQKLGEGALVFIRPEDTHCHDYDEGNDCQFINLAFMNIAVEEVLNFLGKPSDFHELLTSITPPYAMLPSLEKERFISGCEDFRVLSTIDKKSARIHIRGMLADLLTRYFLVFRNKKAEGIPLWFETLLTQMQKQENFTAGIDKMYELSGRSSGHVNRLFRQYLHIRPTTFINQLRLNFAKSLLLTSEMSIIDISMHSGFENLTYFYRLFKQHFGITPLSLREKKFFS